MTIATDSSGENIAFGVTVPVITPAHSAEQVKDFCDTIAIKLAARRKELNTEAQDELDSFTIPLPIGFVETDTVFDVQEAALSAALQMARSLHVNGYTVMNCTPAAMADDVEKEHNVTVGYVLVATYTPFIAQKAFDQEDEDHPLARLWTEYTSHVYGRAAINRAMAEMQALMAGVSDKSDSIH